MVLTITLTLHYLFLEEVKQKQSAVQPVVDLCLLYFIRADSVRVSKYLVKGTSAMRVSLPFHIQLSYGIVMQLS